MPRAAALFLVAFAIAPSLLAQTPRAEFDVVSMKRSAPDAVGGSMRTLPDGTSIMTNVAIRQFITLAAAVPVREVRGLPDWAEDERYDVTARPPAGSTREQRGHVANALC